MSSLRPVFWKSRSVGFDLSLCVVGCDLSVIVLQRSGIGFSRSLAVVRFSFVLNDTRLVTFVLNFGFILDNFGNVHFLLQSAKMAALGPVNPRPASVIAFGLDLSVIAISLCLVSAIFSAGHIFLHTSLLDLSLVFFYLGNILLDLGHILLEFSHLFDATEKGLRLGDQQRQD